MKIVKLEELRRRLLAGSLYKDGAYDESSTRLPKLARSRSFSLFGALAILSVSIFSSTVDAQVEENPLSPKPNLMWLSDDVNVSVFGDGEYDSFLGKSEIWTNNWGVSAKLLQNDNNDVFGQPRDSKYFNFDVKHRVLGSQGKSNLELGLGWQQMNIDSRLDASGPKLSLSGRYDVLRSVQVYGLTSYFPELEDELRDGEATGYEIEAGLLYKPLPSWSLKAGYRVFSLDLEDSIVEELGSSSGFLLGTDLSW
ncbi:MAG: opacity protein-like surface antigen [Arenicella sp.]|jgi:opacity protein-like surface antigen